MAVLPILTAESPILRHKSRPVKAFDGDLQSLVEDMLETLWQANGLGLAAPQVGVLKRLIVIEMPTEGSGEDDKAEPRPRRRLVLVNPEITSREGEELDEEGCLSIPGYAGQVKRATAVTVRAQTIKGKRTRLTADGLLARALQHEIDHLDGVLYIDRVEKAEDIRKLAPEERWDRPPDDEAAEPTGRMPVG